MANIIYDLDNAGGGQILGSKDNTQAALTLNTNAAGYQALAIQSTASGAAVKISGIQGIGIDVDGKDANSPAIDARNAVATGRALIVGRTALGATTIAAVQFLHPSTASAAVMEFQGGFISCTSIEFTSAAQFDYAIPISLNGVIRYIPLCQGAAVDGGAAL